MLQRIPELGGRNGSQKVTNDHSEQEGIGKMFAISSMRPSLFRAEVSLLVPLQPFRLCWVLVYSEERKCYRPPRIFIFRDLRRGSTGTFPTYVFRVFAYFPAVLPRKVARGAALRGHPGQVRMLQKMPKY